MRQFFTEFNVFGLILKLEKLAIIFIEYPFVFFQVFNRVFIFLALTG